jgi:hypothetical protein
MTAMNTKFYGNNYLQISISLMVTSVHMDLSRVCRNKRNALQDMRSTSRRPVDISCPVVYRECGGIYSHFAHLILPLSSSHEFHLTPQVIQQYLMSIDESPVLRSNELHSGNDLMSCLVIQLLRRVAQNRCENGNKLLRKLNNGCILVFIYSI